MMNITNDVNQCHFLASQASQKGSKLQSSHYALGNENPLELHNCQSGHIGHGSHFHCFAINRIAETDMNTILSCCRSTMFCEEWHSAFAPFSSSARELFVGQSMSLFGSVDVIVDCRFGCP